MLVLGATMLITVIGYAAIVTARINTRIVTSTNDWARAGELAIATAELAPLILTDSPDWRTDLTSGEPVSFKLDGCEVNLVFIDEDDDDFSTGLYDPIRAYGIAMVGDAVRVRRGLGLRHERKPLGVGLEHDLDQRLLGAGRAHQGLTAIHSISRLAPTARPFTATVERAGFGSGSAAA